MTDQPTQTETTVEKDIDTIRELLDLKTRQEAESLIESTNQKLTRLERGMFVL
jgi:hypothetical protein